MDDKRLIWEIIKLDIRNYTIIYSSQKKKKQKQVINDLNKRHNNLHTKIHSDNANVDDRNSGIFNEKTNQFTEYQKNLGTSVILSKPI